MKSAVITDEIKKKAGLTRNDEIIPWLESALAAKVTPPLGATIIISNGQITSTTFGFSNPAVREEIEMFQRVLREVITQLDNQRLDIVRRDVTAELTTAQDEKD